MDVGDYIAFGALVVSVIAAVFSGLSSEVFESPPPDEQGVRRLRFAFDRDHFGNQGHRRPGGRGGP